MVNNSLKKDINNAISIIEDNSKCSNCTYKKYSVIPIKGTENVKELFQQIDNSFEKSLIVTGSGDQILEAILHGAKHINSFDLNLLTKYGTELKYAAIKALEYEEFVRFYTKKFELNLYDKVRNFLNSDILLFWDSIFDFTYHFTIYDNLFDVDNHGDIIDCNFSIYNKKSYYKIKEKLLKSLITFTHCSLEKLSKQSISL